ncbi:MAG: hypothetical protein KDD67_09690 [Ignavibacteriae bacterium]|nr:hypothetical protein [Ignavibacteriota bacterium]
MNLRTITLTLLCLPLFATGCANFASFQSADVVEKGETSTGGGITYSSYSFEFIDTVEDFTVPALYLWGRYGLTDRLQAHLNAWIPLGGSIGAKYQLIGSPEEEGFGLSTGFDIGYLQVTASGSDDNSSADDADLFTKIDLYFPLYLGYDLSESTSLYLVPKYIGSINSGANSEFASTFTTALGIKLGFLYLEGSYGRDFSVKAPVSHVGVGFNL